MKTTFGAIIVALAATAAAQTAEQRAREILLPDRVIRDQPVTAILVAIADDSVKADPNGVGVSIIVRDDDAGSMARRRLTLTFRSLTVERALRLLAAAAALRLQFDPNAIIVTPSKNVVGPTMETRPAPKATPPEEVNATGAEK